MAAGPRRLMMATVIALAFAATACNGGDDGAAQPTETATATAAPVATEAASEAEAPPADGEGRTYVVKRGDTLSEIAERFDTTVRKIVQANNIKDPDRLKVGQELVIPD